MRLFDRFFAFGLLLLVLGGAGGNAWGQRLWLGLFGSRDCDECAQIKEEWNENHTEPEDPVVVYMCMDDKQNYDYLKKIEAAMKIKRPSTSFPIVLVGDVMVAGLDGLLELMPDQLDEHLVNVPALPVLEAFQKAADEATTPVVEIFASDILGGAMPESEKLSPLEMKAEHPELLYIFQTGCQKCSRQLKELKFLAQKVPSLKLACYNIAEPDGQTMLNRIKASLPDEAFEGTELAPPLVVWDDGIVSERLATVEELLPVLQKQEDIEHFWNAPITSQEQQTTLAIMENVMDKTTVGTIALAGLLDGINPCAFATSIFLIGYLLYLKRKPRQIVAVGIAFCAGVFITYLLFGIGLSFVINYLNRFVWIKMAIYGIFGLVAAVLAVMNIRDAVIFKKTNKAASMNLGLSGETHHKMHEKIRKWVNVGAWFMIPAALVLGTVISSMELACTGQIYLPTLAAINSTDITRRAFSLLILYNVAFILPLVVVTILAACGTGAKKLADWARNNVFNTKVIMGVLFSVLAILMLWFAIHAVPKNLPDGKSVNCLLDDDPQHEETVQENAAI